MKEKLNAIRTALNSALAYVEDEHGVTLNVGSMSYDQNGFVSKLTCTFDAEDGSKITPEAINFKEKAHTFGLSPDDLGKTFEDWQNVKWKIVGSKARAQKAPILVERLKDKKVHKMKAEQVVGFLKLTAA